MTTRTAQCACGRVKIAVENEPLRVLTCHCDFCQKRTGSVFQVSAQFAEEQVVETLGDTNTYNGLEIDGVGAAGSGISITYHFCATCGSTIYWDPVAPMFPITLREFLLTRILELVVHVDDLAHSVGERDLGVDRRAIDIACHLGIDINAERYGSAAVLRSLFRRDRNSLDALRTF